VKLQKSKQGIYGCWNGNRLVYVGSTGCTLSDLEQNHRNWEAKGYTGTRFRLALSSEGQDWTFEWLQEPLLRTKERIEIEEGTLIRIFKPKYNKDQDPYKSSIDYNRYTEKV